MKRGPKHGNLLGISLDSTTKIGLLEEVESRLDSKRTFYIVTPNPEIVLKATSDWLLKKAINHATFSVPDGIGIKFAYKLLHNEDVEVIKGRELFYDLLEIANKRGLRVFLVGGYKDSNFTAVKILAEEYKNIKFQTAKTPIYNHRAQPTNDETRRQHKKLMGSVKLFEPDLIFVGIGAPKQEKWILRHFFRTKAIGAMTVGGTFNYIAGISKIPPKWLANLGLEWLWRVILEPNRIVRIWNAVIVFTFRILIAKLFKQKFKG